VIRQSGSGNQNEGALTLRQVAAKLNEGYCQSERWTISCQQQEAHSGRPSCVEGSNGEGNPALPQKAASQSDQRNNSGMLPLRNTLMVFMWSFPKSDQQQTNMVSLPVITYILYRGSDM
jgi:hypothetical protein